MTRFLRFLWVALTCGVIVMSLIPPDSQALDPLSSLNDKLLHFAGYAVLGALPAVHEPGKNLCRILLFLMLLGGVLEVVQALSGLGRSFEYYDFFAGTGGCLLGAIAALPFRRILTRRSPGVLP